MLKKIGLHGNRAKVGLIVVIVVGIIVIGFLIKTNVNDTQSKDVVTKKPLQDVSLLCANPDCAKSFTIKAKEYEEIMRAEVKSWSDGRPPATGPVALTCKFCGKKTAYPTKKDE